MKSVIAYTDGACRGNPGPGGWGVSLRYGQHLKELCEIGRASCRERVFGYV